MSMSSSQDRLVSEQRENEQRIVVSTQQARQGVTGHNVRYVLGIGVAGGDRRFCGALRYLFS
jgi:hypothetical protein